MASALGMRTVAEGVETQAQWAMLSTVGATQAQGYLLSRPCTLQGLQQCRGQWRANEHQAAPSAPT